MATIWMSERFREWEKKPSAWPWTRPAMTTRRGGLLSSAGRSVAKMKANAINAAWRRNVSGMVQSSEKRVMIAPDWKIRDRTFKLARLRNARKVAAGQPAVGRPLLRERG